MATAEEIASLALTRIGHEGIASFSASGNKASRWFYTNYEIIKKALLREHPWNFAIKRATLSSTTAPTNEYTSAYTLPADFLRLVRLNGDAKVGYRIERGTLVTDEVTAVLEYVYDVTDGATFTADFTDLLAQRLAAEISLYMTDSASTQEGAWKIYQSKLAAARGADSRESAPRSQAANLALARLGEAAGRQGEEAALTIENAARIIEANYATVRKSLLREHPWNFAVKRVALSSTTAPVNEYTRAFTLPADCLRVVKLNASTTIGYRIEAKTLTTDETTATIEYIADVTVEANYDAAFLDLLAQRLAAEAAIAVNPQGAQAMWRLYEEKLARAKATDSREAAPRKAAANLALIRLGEPAGRGGEDAHVARETAARVVESLYDSVRKSLLREHAWNFAVKRGILSKDTIRTITGATANNPVVVTSAAHGFSNGDIIYIDSVVGMTQLNGRTFLLTSVTTNTFILASENGIAHNAYSSGGFAYPYVAKEFRYRFALPSDCIRLLRINRTEADEYRVEQGYIYTDESEVDIEYVMDVTTEASFDTQFADVLAQRLAAEAAVSVNPGAAGAMWVAYERKLMMARAMNAREGTPRNIEADTWLDSRA